MRLKYNNNNNNNNNNKTLKCLFLELWFAKVKLKQRVSSYIPKVEEMIFTNQKWEKSYVD